MNNQLLILFVGLIGLIIGALIMWLLGKTKQNRLEDRQTNLSEQVSLLNHQIETSNNERNQLRTEREQLVNELTKKEAENNHLHQQNIRRDEELAERQALLKEQVGELKTQISKIEIEREQIRNDKETLLTQLTKRNEENANLHALNEKRDQELEERQLQLRTEFSLLANKILDEKSSKFTEQNKANIENILNPLQEKIKTFEKKVEDSQKENLTIHSALREKLIGLEDLNKQMSLETTNLTKALKGDSKVQGNWGELVLERVLEKSGLEKNREYFVQQSFTTDEGVRVLPDVVIHLPEGKRMIIDSKVSLTDYERLVSAEREEEPQFLKAHVNSLKRHVDQLSAKNYQDLYDIESPDFVLMFIPIEPAFAAAVNEDSSLYNKAFEKNIVIVTPSTLLATLLTIDTMWNNEKQQRNALEIAKEAGKLYDKVASVVDNFVKLGKQMKTANDTYQDGMRQMTTGGGNVISKLEKIKKMGAKANKELPESIVKRAKEGN